MIDISETNLTSTDQTWQHCFVQMAQVAAIAGEGAFFSYNHISLVPSLHAAVGLVLFLLRSCSFSQDKYAPWLGGGMEGMNPRLRGRLVSFLSIFFTLILKFGDISSFQQHVCRISAFRGTVCMHLLLLMPFSASFFTAQAWNSKVSQIYCIFMLNLCVLVTFREAERPLHVLPTQACNSCAEATQSAGGSDLAMQACRLLGNA